MARRRNPDDDLPRWVWPAVAGFGALVVISAIVHQVSKVPDKDKPIYYYWTDAIDEGVFSDYVPSIQNSQTGITFVLPAEETESWALDAAREAIADRGGRAQQGRPVG